MAQITWRGSDELIERVKRSARDQGRSMNDYVTVVLDAATDPDLAGGDAERLRERLARAGLTVATAPTRARPSARHVARARASASRGTPLSTLINDGR